MTARNGRTLGAEVKEYLKHRRSLGFGLVLNEVVLRDFVRFAAATASNSFVSLSSPPPHSPRRIRFARSDMRPSSVFSPAPGCESQSRSRSDSTTSTSTVVFSACWKPSSASLGWSRCTRR
jgi:hypothetical protein